MAFRIVVAGSSPELCEELTHIVDLDGLNIELAGMAHSGTKLQSLVLELRPDIVITELELSGTAVLDTIRITNQDGAGCKFIVISKIKQFEYVYHALKCGVSDYLLAPVQPAELDNALRKVVAELSALYEKGSIDTDTARDAFMMKLRTQPGSLPLELSQVNSRYCTSFQKGLFLPFFIKLDFCGDSVSFQENLFAPQRKIRQYLEELLRPLCFDVLAEHRQVALNVLLCFPAENECAVWSALLDLLHMAQRTAEGFSNAVVTICVGEVVADISELENARWCMCDAVWLRMFRGMGTVLRYSDIPALNPEETASLCSLRAQADSALQRGSFSDFELSLTEFFALPKAILSHHEARLWVEETLDAFFQENDEALSRIALPSQLLEDTKRMLNLSSSYREYAAIYMSRMKELSSKIMSVYSQGHKKPVRDIIRFVETHYSERLGIETAAVQVGLSPVYFSHLFKAETGKNFTDFVTEYRMNIAKERLLRDDTGIGEIAEAVGYSDQRYFSRQFKKLTGITPSAYRNTFGTGRNKKP